MGAVARFHSEPEAKRRTGAARERWFHRAFFLELVAVVRGMLPGLSRARTIQIARCMVAHVAAETGHGAGIYNHNPGNIHHVKGRVGTSSYYEGTDRNATGGAYATRFASYPSRRAGLVVKVAVVLRSPRRRAFLLGDEPADRYFVVMRQTGYFEGLGETDAEYVVAMRNRLATITRDTADLEPPSQAGRAARFTLALAGAAALAAAAGALPLPRSLTV